MKIDGDTEAMSDAEAAEAAAEAIEQAAEDDSTGSKGAVDTLGSES